jgi:DNA invertase Pin-like site-specific DNA recombinase
MAGLMKGSTTSMGRLTLNVLLSFAQFEREVTGERIRDKIAASKLKREVEWG